MWGEPPLHTLELGADSPGKLIQGRLSQSSFRPNNLGSWFITLRITHPSDKVLEAMDSGKMCVHTEVCKLFMASMTHWWVLNVLRSLEASLMTWSFKRQEEKQNETLRREWDISVEVGSWKELISGMKGCHSHCKSHSLKVTSPLLLGRKQIDPWI